MKYFKRGLLNSILGTYSEQIAIDYIKNIKKYKIVDSDYKNKIGQIDIIAKDKSVLVFVEVKSASSLSFGSPAQRVDAKKQRKIKNVAQVYLKSTRKMDSEIRFDVVEILDEKINYIENAF